MPSTRRCDRLLKRDRFEQAGIASYWLVDPDEPGVLVLELRGGHYVEAGRAAGNERLAVRAPYDVVLWPTCCCSPWRSGRGTCGTMGA